MNARAILIQSGTGPKFIRSRVNGSLVSCQSLPEKWEVPGLMQLVENISSYLTALLYMKCVTPLSLLLQGI